MTVLTVAVMYTCGTACCVGPALTNKTSDLLHVLQAFLQQGNKLISCSKDSHVRVWDLDTQHCSQTLVGYRGEVWALALDPTQSRLVTGSADVDLQVYEVLSHEAAGKEAGISGQHDTLKSMGISLAFVSSLYHLLWLQHAVFSSLIINMLCS
jgi:WD40 repeat protein